MNISMRISLFYLLLIVNAACASDVDDINRNYSLYKKALMDNNSLIAAGLISQETLNYYSKVRDIALNAKKSDLRQLSLSEQLLVLTLRQRLSKIDLSNVNGKSLFMLSIKNGWISRSSVQKVSLGEIRVSGNMGSADCISRGKKSRAKFVFIRENGIWKFHLIAALTQADNYIKAYASRAKITNQQIVEALVEKSTGIKVTEALWNGY